MLFFACFMCDKLRICRYGFIVTLFVLRNHQKNMPPCAAFNKKSLTFPLWIHTKKTRNVDKSLMRNVKRNSSKAKTWMSSSNSFRGVLSSFSKRGKKRQWLWTGGTFTCVWRIGWLTPLSMLPVWHRVPSAAGILLVTQRLLLLRHQSSLHTS